MHFEINQADGSLVFNGNARIGRGTSPEEALAVFQAEVIGEGSSRRPLVQGKGELDGRTFELSFHFRGHELAQTILVGMDHPPDEHDAQKALRDRAFLNKRLGPPGYENARGSMHAYSWGWVYAINGTISFVYPDHPSPVPLPGQGKSEGELFRCCGCGHLMDLGYGQGVLSVNKRRGGVPCEACGAVSWVKAGSMTEFYSFSQRAWVCEVGMHPAEGVKIFRLVASDPPPQPTIPGALRLSGLLVKACPQHVETLRCGLLGCVLPEGAVGEDPK